MQEPIDIGPRRQLFVDDHLVDRASGVERQLNRPTPAEVVIEHDEPWEGSSCSYHTVFRDGDRYRMYYRASDHHLDGAGPDDPDRAMVTCYAESGDGVGWEKPELGLVSVDGSTANNVLGDWPESHNLMPFKDANPNTDPDARYKAVGSPRLVDEKTTALFAFQSSDGIEWERLDDDPIIPSSAGSFDSPNVVFWDTVRGEYRAYFRYFAGEDDRRAIATATSPDFRSWSDPVPLSYPDAPPEQLYTNCVRPYHRAPHLFVGFPARYVTREWTPSMEDLPGLDHRRRRGEENERFGTALTDTLLMTSRDGARFGRWPRAFVPPGLLETDSMANWAYGDNYVAWHPVETESRTDDVPPELSLYATENHWNPEGSRLRRYTLRLDGFVSVQADRDGGELVTPPLRFDGSQLRVNAATSAAGSLRVELLDAEGDPVDGAALSDSVAFFGDALDATVRWERGADVSRAAGQPVRIRFVLAEADLYSFRFAAAD